MKYEIDIEGGFAGIPRTYKGERSLEKEEKTKLLHSLQKPILDKNKKARDAFSYKLKLTDNDIDYNFEFDEFNIPKEVRMFIDSVIKTK
ncbi:hypothetical protein KCTC52924_03309 [Arenibacter antarcticus]|uniref:Protealysin inhibitor emfourin n=1 Tax=Arenibacter antarcticus TaxID=2040469 RepID=A0ABW5VJ24_9FLAO|nr:protealysin inhibitor emfourin [Arenibacter sp. H213]MCM4166376.1 hypothetical protein [Arenibacter sp. H213]